MGDWTQYLLAGRGTTNPLPLWTGSTPLTAPSLTTSGLLGPHYITYTYIHNFTCWICSLVNMLTPGSKPRQSVSWSEFIIKTTFKNTRMCSIFSILFLKMCCDFLKCAPGKLLYNSNVLVVHSIMCAMFKFPSDKWSCHVALLPWLRGSQLTCPLSRGVTKTVPGRGHSTLETNYNNPANGAN